MTTKEEVAAVPCIECNGGGVTPEHHDYATEYLACGDCRGTGEVEGKYVAWWIAALRNAGYIVTPPSEVG